MAHLVPFPSGTTACDNMLHLGGGAAVLSSASTSFRTGPVIPEGKAEQNTSEAGQLLQLGLSCLLWEGPKVPQIDLHSMKCREGPRKHSRPQDWELTILSKHTMVNATTADLVHQRQRNPASHTFRVIWYDC